MENDLENFPNMVLLDLQRNSFDPVAFLRQVLMPHRFRHRARGEIKEVIKSVILRQLYLHCEFLRKSLLEHRNHHDYRLLPQSTSQIVEKINYLHSNLIDCYT